MAPANETPATPSQAEEDAEFEALFEKAKKLPPGMFRQLNEQERKMREMAAADPEMARYLENLCRSYLSSQASSTRPGTKLEEEEKSKKKEEEKSKKKEEEKSKKKEEEKSKKKEGEKSKKKEEEKEEEEGKAKVEEKSR